MSLSRFFNLRFLVVTSAVCCSTGCGDDDSKPVTTSDAGDESSSTSGTSASSTTTGTSSSGSSSSTKPTSSGTTGTTDTQAIADAGDAGIPDEPDEGLPPTTDGGAVDGSADADVDDRIPLDAILTGVFAPLVTPEAGTNPSGRVQLQKLSSGETVVALQAVGLEPDTEYAAHVHALPCEFNAGGGHYKIDPTITAMEESNEIWPSFTTNATGVGYGRVSVDHRVRGDALSVVIHAGGAKFLCADLLPETMTALGAEGSFEPFAAQGEVDEDIAGGVTLVHAEDNTIVTMSVTGLDPSAEYMAHVHALPCEITDAGGHYKIDPTVTDTLESNEVWPMLELTDGGAAMGVVTVDHVTRWDAQSVVIHRQDGDTALKVACANLVYSGFEDSVTEGELALLDTVEDAGVPELEGEATMTRALDGTTKVELSLAGLLADTDYGVHVHDMPCWLNSGGGHYKVDESISATVEENEIWLNVTSSGDGDAERTVTELFLARPEAQAIVVHAPGGARVGCIDLL